MHMVFGGGRDPYGSLELQKVRARLMATETRPDPPSDMPLELISVMSLCWKFEPSKRVRIGHVLKQMKTFKSTERFLSEPSLFKYMNDHFEAQARSRERMRTTDAGAGTGGVGESPTHSSCTHSAGRSVSAMNRKDHATKRSATLRTRTRSRHHS